MFQLHPPGVHAITRTVTVNSVLLATATVVTKALTFSYIFIIMRYLGPERYGKYCLAYSFVAMLAFGSELGLASFTVREVAAKPSSGRQFFANMLSIRLVLALVTFVLTVSLGLVVTPAAPARVGIFLFALAMILDAVSEGMTSFFLAFQRAFYPAVAGMLRAGVVLACVIFFAWNDCGLISLVGATTLGAGAVLAFQILVFVRSFFVPIPSLHFEYLRSMLRNALPYAAMALITNLFFRIDMVMLSLIKGDLETGLYGAAYRIMESLLFISTAVNSAALPALARLLASSPAEVGVIFRQAFRWLVWLGLPMAVGLTMTATPVMALFGKGYGEAAPCLQVLAWALFLMFINHLSGTLLTAAGRQVMLAKICAVALAANVLLNLLLIPRFGRMGAAWVTLLCECGFVPALFLPARRYLDMATLLYGLWRPSVSAAGLGVFCFLFADHSLMVLVPGGAVVYGVLLAATYLARRG